MKLKDLDEKCVIKLISYFMKNKNSQFILEYLAKYMKKGQDKESSKKSDKRSSKQSGKQGGKQKNKQANAQAAEQADKQAETQSNAQSSTQAGEQTDKSAEEQSDKQLSEQKPNEQIKGEFNGFQFLNLIINLPTNEVFVVQNLHQLDTSIIVDILEYLLKYLKLYSASPLDIKLHSLCVPKYENVLNWVTMIIDAHSTNLLLIDKKGIELIAEIKKEVNLQLEICDNILNMQGWLGHLLECKNMPDTSHQSYSMEVFYA